MAARKTAAQRKAEKEAQEQAELEALRGMGAANEEEQPEQPEETQEEEQKSEVEPVVLPEEEPEVADVSDVPDGYAKIRGVTKANTISFMELPPEQDEEIVLMSGDEAIVRKTFGFRRAVMNRRIEVL